MCLIFCDFCCSQVAYGETVIVGSIKQEISSNFLTPKSVQNEGHVRRSLLAHRILQNQVNFYLDSLFQGEISSAKNNFPEAFKIGWIRNDSLNAMNKVSSMKEEILGNYFSDFRNAKKEAKQLYKVYRKKLIGDVNSSSKEIIKDADVNDAREIINYIDNTSKDELINKKDFLK